MVDSGLWVGSLFIRTFGYALFFCMSENISDDYG